MVKVFQVLVILAGVCLFSDFGNALFLNQLRENCQPICRKGKVTTVPVYCGIFFRNDIKCRENPEAEILVEKLGQMVTALKAELNGEIGKVNEKLNGDIGKVNEKLNGDIGKVNEKLNGDIGKVNDTLNDGIGKVNDKLKVEIEKVTDYIKVSMQSTCSACSWNLPRTDMME